VVRTLLGASFCNLLLDIGFLNGDIMLVVANGTKITMALAKVPANAFGQSRIGARLRDSRTIKDGIWLDATVWVLVRHCA